jgi:glucosyl-3-phosphoglycerate synthase
MWRALEVLGGDVVAYVDADSRDFSAHFVCGLLGPLLCGADAAFVKGFYRRPFDFGTGARTAEGGGRVTELTARPLLAAFYPELASVRQPLAGEIAVRRDLLEALPFTTGYGVDVGLLIDAYERCGIDAIAQVDLDQRQNRHRPLSELAPMAAAVTDAIVRRVSESGRLVGGHDAVAIGDLMPHAAVRPPVASLRPLAA